MTTENGIIGFLREELEQIQEQELEDSILTNAEKVDKGILLEHCTFITADAKERTVHLACRTNNTKFRTGDTVSVTKSDGTALKGTTRLLENGEHELVIQTSSLSFFDPNSTYHIECTSFNQHDTVIELL